VEIVELIIQILIEGLIEYPGAAIRWLLFRKKPFKKYLLDNTFINLFPILVLVAIIILIVNLV
jgi:hypothetical protein